MILKIFIYLLRCLLIATAREFPAAKFLTDQRPVQRRIQELLDSPFLPRKIEIVLHRYLVSSSLYLRFSHSDWMKTLQILEKLVFQVKEEPDSTSNSEAEQNYAEEFSEGNALTLTRSLRRKLWMRLFFRRFQGEEVEFFLNRTSLISDF